LKSEKFKNTVGVRKSHILCLFVLFLIATQCAHAQKERRIIQLSGVVLGSDSLNAMLPGVHIYVPKAGRGAITNELGFFSMPVLVGDSIVISYVGYDREFYIVPEHPSEYLTIIIQLTPDATFLDNVEIMPFPTEEVFKEAVLALNIPTDDQSIDRRNLNQELLALMMKTTPMDGPQNQRYYLGQMAAAQGSQYAPITNPLFNPFNWAKFFRSLKQDKK
jgi:hypothetical protein